MTDLELIAYYGGPSKFARLLRLDGDKGVRRVCNWKVRGIPPAIKVAFPALFKIQNRRRSQSSNAAVALHQEVAHG